MANPGTVVALETVLQNGVGQRFKYAFFALGACVKGYAFMRKVIIIDGTHLKGKYGDCLLTASAQDDNYQIFPLAFAIVDSENDLAWEWFFTKLLEVIPDALDLVFISDRHSSIYPGLEKVYPLANHCACIIHLQRNIKAVFKKKALQYLVSRAARAFHLSDFYTLFNEIKITDISCTDYLINIGFEHWARSHAIGARYNIMTSNIAESLNAVFRGAREYPIIQLVEFIRTTIMKWFTDRRQLCDDDTYILTPKVHGIISNNFERSTGYGVQRINTAEYEVRNKNRIAYVVDLENKRCSCCEFQMLCILCEHVVVAAVEAKINIDTLTKIEYTSAYWKMAYMESIYPVPDKHEDHAEDALSSLPLLPPSTRHPPGRPRKKRFFIKE